MGWRRGSYDDEAVCRWREGPQLKTNARSDKDRGIGDEPNNSIPCSEFADACTQKRRNRPTSFPCAVRQVYRKMFWLCLRTLAKHGGAAEWTARHSRTSKRTAGRWLDELAQELKSRTITTSVRRVYIPKPDGKQRPLGVPAIRDRAAKCGSFGSRTYFRVRSAAGTVRLSARPQRTGRSKHVHKLINTGHGEIVDADLSSYLIPFHIPNF